jgi:hypothetical protein
MTKTNWQDLHIDNLTFTELKEVILDTYEIDADIADSICFRFVTHVGINRRNIHTKMRSDEMIENTNKGRTYENGEVYNRDNLLQPTRNLNRARLLL